jgi:FkbM family methyltransferase
MAEKGAWDPGLRAIDVVFAYRLLLDRFPEEVAHEALEARAGEFATTERIMRGFLSSWEFRQRYYGTSTRPDGRLVIVRDGNLRIAVNLDDLAIGWSIINGDYEQEVLWAIRNLIPEGATCVDVGANVGYFTVHMADCVGERGRVFAYEPLPPLLRLLKISVEESGFGDLVRIKPAAVANSRGASIMFLGKEVDNWGGGYLAGSEGMTPNHLDVFETEVVSLDTDLEGAPPVDFIKMDVEGGEYEALLGATSRLERDRPLIVLELNDSCLARKGVSRLEILEFLESREYVLLDLASLFSGHVTRTAQQPCAAGFENVLGIPGERVDAVLEALGRCGQCGDGESLQAPDPVGGQSASM